ncbi:hypothetical protein ICY20_12440 [Pseudomonas sp. P115]|uniref:hypothetical protein n=1 Tax=Pseudomonas pisciculturae TaxID=2730413 RepID=UPI001892285C|nr:hypothetical protein [Pseudomonas pisciculturae]MBF6028543.1 hypothetical protein [Pseudomonas pisciculturae]
MDASFIPSTVFVAFGVIVAALLTGVFSIMNLVGAKENKVSEFRLAWIDGLRNEIAEYTSAAQELSRIYKPERFAPLKIHSEKEAHELKIESYKETREAYARATENLTKIQLRLNPVQIEKEPGSHEAKLMAAVLKARKSGSQEFSEVLKNCNDIRTAAAPILKSTWDSVKRGESAYRRFRVVAIVIVLVGFNAVIVSGIYIGLSMYNAHERNAQKELALKLFDAVGKLDKKLN